MSLIVSHPYANVNTAYSLFSGKIQKHFNYTFPLVKLSRKRARDKN